MSDARCGWQMRLPGGRWVVCGVVGCKNHPESSVPGFPVAALEILGDPMVRVVTDAEIEAIYRHATKDGGLDA